ncbi:glycosyl transferase [Weizmannia acidilactici]|jgi:glycosyltransferase involved in cell wall biosynthesis|uniref:Glycosyl transferase n=1 Tax=Weizmannia acidilactici TaxID=2607726 RepID=A0A5J4JMP3_9BACI|nr:glycosyltransferase family 1 protein [Weizmannia acidilactici]GER67516.1 glycosyl transferase [Weizmannia acidilactici]GER71647.1 glycosyl transferase [Weizmannia acidilactici]GER73461.1 glycosyl transferase [Weizmannia acidilactici]
MKIAIITETFLPSTDGIVTRLCASIRWLKQHGHEVLVIAPDLGVSNFEGIPVAGVPAHTFFLYKDKKFAFLSQKVKRYLLEFGPDLVHIVNPALLGATGIYYTKCLKFPLIASYHTEVPKYADYYHLPFLKPVLWWYFRLLHNRADLNLCTSMSVLKELEGKKFKNVHLWKRGVDTGLFGPDRFNAKMRTRLTARKTDKKLLLYVGRLAPEKGIEKIREVLDLSDDFCLAIVGDGPHRNYLENYFKGTPTVFTGFLHGEELASAYASSDIFVFPSTTETLGLVLLEAMASGLPVVAAESGPTKEQVTHGRTGLLYHPDIPDDFIQQVTTLKDDELRRRLSKNAREAARKFGWDAPSRQLLAFYKETVKGCAFSRKMSGEKLKML